MARRDPTRTADADLTIARLILPDFEGAAPEGWWARLKRWLNGGHPEARRDAGTFRRAYLGDERTCRLPFRQ